MRKLSIAIVVPAYNEAAVISESLKSLREVIGPDHIFVVSDGSTDQTAKLARALVPNVLALRRNRGKAGALKELIDKFQLTNRYRYVFFFDADTRIGPKFLREVRKIIKASSPALIVGTVKPGRHKAISAYRVYEYGLSHIIFKNAQNAMGTIAVAPGCASVYRSDVLDKLDFHGGSLTEDLDLTIQIHHKKLGHIIYCPRACVTTQDPATFGDYWKQITRWNTGFWQNFFGHRLYIPSSKINGEFMLLLGDLLFWLVLLILSATRPLELLYLYGLALCLSSFLGAVISVSTGQYWALPYTPLFGFFQSTNLVSTIYSFFRAVFSERHHLNWQKVERYELASPIAN
jgi:cellulose synthase/poly-beta-1,6-N-acetylglucosamine synthase-like glycosyltransferase